MRIENEKDYLKKEKVVLSIVIPTLNRKKLLEITLEFLLKQMSDAVVATEVIVCDNASNDGTEKLFAKGGIFTDLVKYVRYDERVDIDASFARSIALCSGRYVNLFGDDDIPLPGFLKELTTNISTYTHVDLFYINRIIADENMFNASFIPHCDAPFGHQLLPISNFISKFTHWPGFISSLVFTIESWERGKTENQYFEGFDFLNRIYVGCDNGQACFIASPLLIQRKGVQSWKKHWPKYWLISIPKLLTNLEDKNITCDALKAWQTNEISTKRFLIDSFVAKAYSYPVSSSFWKDSRQYQVSLIRQFGSLVIQYLLPSILAKFLYSKTNKMT